MFFDNLTVAYCVLRVPENAGESACGPVATGIGDWSANGDRAVSREARKGGPRPRRGRSRLARSKFQIKTEGADISRFPKVIRGALSSSKEIATQVLSIIVNYQDMGFYGGRGTAPRARKLQARKIQVPNQNGWRFAVRFPVDCQIRGEFPI